MDNSKKNKKLLNLLKGRIEKYRELRDTTNHGTYRVVYRLIVADLEELIKQYEH